MLSLYGFYFPKEGTDKQELKVHFNRARREIDDFDAKWLNLVLEIHSSDLILDPAADLRLTEIVDKGIDDKITEFYTLIDEIHNKGYLHDDSIEATKVFYNSHAGKSTINECVRATIFKYFHRFIKNLEPKSYNEYFELSKIFPTYMGIFDNQQFNQNLKDLCMSYIKKCLKVFTDKRGKAYQDIKRFVQVNFKDLEFLKPKQIVELFKTTRKRTPKTTT